MPAFSYIAIDEQGRTKRGVVQADAARQARAGLRSAGLVPVELSVVEAEAGLRRPGRLFSRRRISATELTLLTRRLAMLLEAGLTLEQGLDALVDQCDSDTSRRILVAVRSEVLAGHSLGAALDPYPSSFPELYRALVRTGELSGDLTPVMSRLADYLERREQARQSVGLALLYPVIVALVGLLIVGGLLGYVVPQVVEVFERHHQSLPLLTRVMLSVSELLRDHVLAIAVAFCAAALAARGAYSREEIRVKWQALLLKVPFLGVLLQGIDSARFASALAILIDSGAPLVQALTGGARILHVLPLRRAVEEASALVREGSSLHRALGSSGLFPPMFLHLVASGEATGRLAHMFAQAAKQQDMENEARLRLWVGLLEPALVIVMGLVVLLVVLAILLPIIEVNQLVRP